MTGKTRWPLSLWPSGYHNSTLGNLRNWAVIFRCYLTNPIILILQTPMFWSRVILDLQCRNQDTPWSSPSRVLLFLIIFIEVKMAKCTPNAPPPWAQNCPARSCIPPPTVHRFGCGTCSHQMFVALRFEWRSTCWLNAKGAGILGAWWSHWIEESPRTGASVWVETGF
jgi:hypothetical protein